MENSLRRALWQLGLGLLLHCFVAKDLLPDRSVVAQHEEAEEQEGSGHRPAGTLMSCDDCAPLFWSTIHFHKYQLAGQVSKLTATATATRLQPCYLWGAAASASAYALQPEFYIIGQFTGYHGCSSPHGQASAQPLARATH